MWESVMTTFTSNKLLLIVRISNKYITMKKVFFVLLFSLLMNYSFGQELTTLLRLNDFFLSLGSTGDNTVDTLLLKARAGKMNLRMAEQIVYLLRAAESYSNRDFETSIYYIRKVDLFPYPEYNNLKFLILVGGYANRKDLENTAKAYYLINKEKPIDHYNLATIGKEIGKNYTREAFNDELAHYFYYHQRLKILDGIEFTE
jgi:hypothetical protein